jgi:hypothetical protein
LLLIILRHDIAGEAVVEPSDLGLRLLCSAGRHELAADRVFVFGWRNTGRDTVEIAQR